MDKDFVLNFSGGIGKHITATSLIKWLNEKYPEKKITIVSPYPEIFEYNPRIFRNLTPNQSYLFEDYIKGKDYRNGEPYQRTEYYDDKKHITEVFPISYGFGKVDGQLPTEIFLTQGEKDEAKMIANQNKPLISIQVAGGLPPGHQMNVRRADIGQRNMPMKMAMLIVNELTARGYKVVQIRSQNEHQIPGTLQLNLPFRNIIALASEIKGHIGIDSSMMHAVGIFKKPMMIFWSQTNVDNMGYKYDKVLNKIFIHLNPLKFY